MKSLLNLLFVLLFISILLILPGCKKESDPTLPNNESATVTYAGKIYNTVKIGNQTWLKENLDIGTMIQGSQNQNNNGTIEKYCYNNDPNNCNTYGGLYKWREAMQYVSLEKVKGICPSGWHIPSLAEFQALSATVSNNSNTLKSIGQGIGIGAGTNTSGFSGLLTGTRYSTDGTFDELGINTAFWSSTEKDVSNAYEMALIRSSNTLNIGGTLPKESGISVRCIKD